MNLAELVAVVTMYSPEARAEMSMSAQLELLISECSFVPVIEYMSTVPRALCEVMRRVLLSQVKQIGLAILALSVCERRELMRYSP